MLSPEAWHKNLMHVQMQLQIIHRRILKKLPSCFSRPQMAPKAPSQEAAAWTVAMCLKDTETKQFFRLWLRLGPGCVTGLWLHVILSLIISRPPPYTVRTTSFLLHTCIVWLYNPVVTQYWAPSWLVTCTLFGTHCHSIPVSSYWAQTGEYI